MKGFIFLILIFMFTFSNGQVNVRGYYRSNGTYVQPYVRTSPNSTVTDNYSYPGNYNPNPPSPTTTYNSNSANYKISNSGDDIWVEGYYRNDGTYVKGYYRRKPSSSTREYYDLEKETNSYSSYRYIKTKNVNIKEYPFENSTTYTTLVWNQQVRTIDKVDNWTKVEIMMYKNNTQKHEIIYGYIKTNLLSENINDVISKNEEEFSTDRSNIENTNITSTSSIESNENLALSTLNRDSLNSTIDNTSILPISTDSISTKEISSIRTDNFDNHSIKDNDLSEKINSSDTKSNIGNGKFFLILLVIIIIGNLLEKGLKRL